MKSSNSIHQIFLGEKVLPYQTDSNVKRVKQDDMNRSQKRFQKKMERRLKTWGAL